MVKSLIIQALTRIQAFCLAFFVIFKKLIINKMSHIIDY
jgi:hypothetical protein